jgi:hypothetical protein
MRLSPHVALRWLLREVRNWLSRVDHVVAGATDHQGLAPPPGHQLDPFRLWPSRSVKVCESADVVHRDAVRVRADLAPIRQEPGDQLFVADDSRDQGPVGDDRVLLPSQWNAAEPCDQWLPATAFDPGFEALARPVWGVDGGRVLAGHIFDTDERCLLARVFSSEVSMTQSSR